MFATEPISTHENSYKTGRIRGDKFSRERCFVGTESYQCITKIKQKVILFTAKEKHTNRHIPPPKKKNPQIIGLLYVLLIKNHFLILV